MQMLSKKDLRHIALNCLNFNLKKVARETASCFDRAFKPLGIKSTQFSILMAASYLEQSSMQELSNLLGLDRTTLTKNLKPLLRDHYLIVRRGEDRRRQLVSLTEAGVQLLVAALPLRQQVHDQIVDQIGGSEYRDLIKMLRRYEHLLKLK